MYKKYIKLIFSGVLFLMFYQTNAYISNVSSVNPIYTNPILSWATCDEVLTSELYVWQWWILVDSFRNHSSHNVYIQWAWFTSDWRLGTDWNPLCLYNNSEYRPGDFRMLSFNKPYLDSIGWKIVPNGFIRHLTTTQEYWSGWQSWIWTFSGSYTNIDLPWNFTFNQANVRNLSNHPLTIATWSTYDCQVKIWTIYDTDDNMATASDNEMLVECKRYQIRWCWDWIKQSQESCEPNDASHSGWGNLWCSASCAPLNSNWWGWGGGWGGWSGGWSSCWNWTVESGEECDLGSGNNNKWSCTTSCKWTYCGDWSLQRPNSTAKWAQFEECDFGTSTWPSWCRKSDCRIIWDFTRPSQWWGDNTTPSDKDWIIFYPSGWALLWNGMKLWDTYSLSLPYIKNNTGYDLYIDKPLCLYKDSKLSLQWNSSICSASQIWALASGQKFDFNVADYTANTALIPAGLSYQDVNLITAPQWLKGSYLSSVLTVRVAKPTVANIYGWTSLLNFNSALYSDVEALSQNFLNDLRNKNFVVASIADTTGKSFSSYVSSVWDKTVYDNSVNNWNSSAATSIAKLSSTWYATPINTLPTEKYNWLSNVFIHKWDVSLEGQAISGNKTFIIENWNLIINWSISAVAGSNIAFIVKWWNIIIGSDVAKIDWVYLAIKQDNIGGKINSDAIKTNNRLIVNGGLYWDARDLIANRTYMKSDNWIINVWTTINFRSGVFTNPPPLLTTFIDEYMKVNKIAK